jgi:hypothetical protein
MRTEVYDSGKSETRTPTESRGITTVKYRRRGVEIEDLWIGFDRDSLRGI